MELRDDVDAATGPADATTALDSAHATAEPVHADIAHVTRVSGQCYCHVLSVLAVWRVVRRSTLGPPTGVERARQEPGEGALK